MKVYTSSNLFKKDFFKHQSQEMAYILGFWYADGGIKWRNKDKNKYGYFRIYNTNFQIMKDMADVLGVTIYGEYPGLNRKYKYTISKSFKEYFDYLYNLVGTTNKSGNSVPLPDLPHELVNGCIKMQLFT